MDLLSLRIQGVVELDFIDSRTGEIIQRIRQKNIIPNDTLLDIVDQPVPTTVFSGKRIAISSQTSIPAFNNSNLTGTIAIGEIPSGVSSPVFITTVSPIYGQIENDIQFSGATRDFVSVGLVAQSASAAYGGGTTRAYAYIKLDTTCTQDAFVVVRARYQIQFPYTGYGLRNWSLEDFGRRLFNLGSFNINRWHTTFVAPPAVPYDYLDTMGMTELTFNSQAKVADHYKYKFTTSYSRTDTSILGRIINSFYYGRGGDGRSAYATGRYSAYTLEPFQTGFWHTGAATTPFFDTGTFGSSTGTITFAGSWTKKWPEIYRINIVTGGAVGTSTYNFQVKKHIGFTGNSFTTHKFATIPYRGVARNPNESGSSPIYGWSQYDPILRWSETKVVQYFRTTGVTLLDLWDGTYTSWSLTTTPAMGATEIAQVAVDFPNDKIYVACRNTGLWQITVGSNTVLQITNTPCYGVAMANGKAFALHHDRLSSSDNWAYSLTINFTGFTDGYWSRCRFMVGDPSHADYRLAFIITDPAGGTYSNFTGAKPLRKIIWWNATTTAAVGGFASPCLNSVSSVNVSETGGFWASYYPFSGHDAGLVKLTFASNSYTQAGGFFDSQGIGASRSGSGTYDFLIVEFYKDKLIGSNKVFNSDLTTAYTFPTDYKIEDLAGYPSPATTFLHLEGGLYLASFNIVPSQTQSSTKLVQIFQGMTEAWVQYYWDSGTSSWTTTGSGNKTTHGTTENLINGLNITFIGATAGSFVAGEFFTRSVNYGLLKDNATDIFATYQWYAKGINPNSTYTATIPNSSPYQLTLPATSDPNFVRIETNSKDLNQFQINGVAINFLYVAGEVPGVNEVTLNGATGVLTFHSSNAGQTFTAVKYCWIYN